MKKVLFIAVMSLLFSVSSYSQEDNSENFVYCEIVGTGKMLSTKVTIQVDFGQKTSFWKGGVGYLKDSNGKKIEFNLENSSRLASGSIPKKPAVSKDKALSLCVWKTNIFISGIIRACYSITSSCP
jgi:hypothetical protein